MSESNGEHGSPAEERPQPRDDEQQEIADFQDHLDEQSDADGLAAEKELGEQTGLAEG